MRSVIAIALCASQIALAQSGPSIGKALTLEDAISIARDNNPAYLQSVNAERSAQSDVRTSYGALLPTSSLSFGSRYQRSGSQFFNGVALTSNSNTLSSSYGLGLNYSVNAASLLQPKAARAQRDAAAADVVSQMDQLRGLVTEQYLIALQAEARAVVADSLRLIAQSQLDLANARVEAGAATMLDVRRSEVSLGQAEVQVLTAHNLAQVEKLRLFQQIGVMSTDTTVQLTTHFEVQAPRFSQDSVMRLARSLNPAVRALQSRVNASNVDHQVAKSRYTPTFSLNTGWGGNAFQYTDPNHFVIAREASLQSSFEGCAGLDSIRRGAGLSSLNCTLGILSDAQKDSIRNSNQLFPFNFTKQPFGVSAQVSVPVFDGFLREQRVEATDLARQNTMLSLRARELQLNTEVTQAYLNLMTAYRTVALQEANATKAGEELSYAVERYRAGAVSFLDVITSRGTFAQAQMDRVNAIYDYHRTFAALESAVGRPLR